MFYGDLKGYIGFERRGQNGFGYDPVFMLPDSGKALSELSLEEKNGISHRGRALARFKRFLSA
jgi:XTP/dITP diphosphohydrolase